MRESAVDLVDSPPAAKLDTRICPECNETTHGELVKSCENCSQAFADEVS
jgi:hypothetical protein